MRTVFLALLLAIISIPLDGNGQTVYRHQLTMAANPAIQFTNDEADEIIAEMNAIMRSATYPSWDTACPTVVFQRNGNVIEHKNLGTSGNSSDLISSLKKNTPSANVLVVLGVQCAGANVAGCTLPGQEPQIVRVSESPFRVQLWLHERGHAVSAPHSAEYPVRDSVVAQDIGMRFMFWQLGLGHVGKKQQDCTFFQKTVLATVLKPTSTSSGKPIVLAAEQSVKKSPTPGADPNQFAKELGLTTHAFQVIAPPWVDSLPLESIKSLSADDIASVRNMLQREPNTYWPQALHALALVGTADDVSLIKKALELPAPAFSPDQDKEAKKYYRNLQQIKLSVPAALGIIANRTQSLSAVELLKWTANVDNAEKIIGKSISEDLGREALYGLSIADMPSAKAYLNEAISSATWKIVPLTPADQLQLKQTMDKVQIKGLNAVLKEKQ